MPLDTTSILIIAAIMLALSCTILYFVVKAAASAANKELLDQLKSANALRVMELKKQGFNLEELRRAGGYYSALVSLEKKKQYMSNDDYRNEVNKLESVFE